MHLAIMQSIIFHYRNTLLQTYLYIQAQYVLLHEALVEALQLPKSAIKMSEFPAEWTKIQADTRPVNQQRLRREYEVTGLY